MRGPFPRAVADEQPDVAGTIASFEEVLAALEAEKDEWVARMVRHRDGDAPVTPEQVTAAWAAMDRQIGPIRLKLAMARALLAAEQEG